MQEPLPGETAQLEMAPVHRKPIGDYQIDPQQVRESGVLILLYPQEEQLSTVLTLRQDYKGSHSGQVSFPGGKVEEEDNELQETALREAEEEIGVKSSEIEVVGSLTKLYIPVSNFLVFPFVGFLEQRPEFIPEEKEVKSIIEVDLNHLSDPAIKDQKKIQLANGLSIHAPYFSIANQTVWGATAMIISEFNAVLKEL